MSDSSQASVLERSSLLRFLRGLFRWRVIRLALIVLAWTATVIALIYAEENWRGRRAWNKYRLQLEARGEQLDLRAFIPKPVADSENFAATPFFTFLFAHKTNSHDWLDNYAWALKRISKPKTTNDAGNRSFTDLAAWEMAFDAIRLGRTNRDQKFKSDKVDPQSRAQAAQPVLEGLKDSEERLAEVRAASQRPYSRYPVFYDLDNPWGILLPHVVNVKLLCQRLQLRACAQLAAGRSQDALQDVKLALYLADSLKEEPFLISYMVRVACVQITIQPVWEGLAEHRWSEAQLQELQSRLQQYDFLADIKHPLGAERAAGILTVDLVRRKQYLLSELSDAELSDSSAGSSDTLMNLLSRVAPRGWYYQEQLSYCRLYEEQLKGTFDPSQRRVWPSQCQSNARELDRRIAGGRLGKGFHALMRHHVMAALLLPALNNVTGRSARAQTATDQAALACALERYRLVHHQFPDKLEGLVPVFIERLPHDVITGKPFVYHRTEDGQFALYSVGWDERDDGGVAGKTLFAEKGDWVWSYPSR